jgi:hypothetical protein
MPIPRRNRLSPAHGVAHNRMHGQPNHRVHGRTHLQAQYAAGRQAVQDQIDNLNNLPPVERQRVEARIEVIKRLPPIQEWLANSKWFSSMVSPGYRESFTLLRYAYGADIEESKPKRYVVERALWGYVVPNHLPSMPSRQAPPINNRGHHRDLVIAAEEDSSWVGALHAHIDPVQADEYEQTIGVGRDIDALEVGDHALDRIARTSSGNIIPRNIVYLAQIADSLNQLETITDIANYPPYPAGTLPVPYPGPQD